VGSGEDAGSQVGSGRGAEPHATSAGVAAPRAGSGRGSKSQAGSGEGAAKQTGSAKGAASRATSVSGTGPRAAAGRGAGSRVGVAALLEPDSETPADLMCSIARSLCVLGERWTFLILREAFSGVTRFSEFRDRLHVAPDVLTDRLATLTEAGVMTRELYQEPGRRGRYAYRLTPAGQELRVVLGSLQQWGDEHLPPPGGPTVERRVRGTGQPLHVGYVDDQGREVALDEVEFVRTANYPAAG
jgi:DNA-binding HxlR family transcriptional regulator